MAVAHSCRGIPRPRLHRRGLHGHAAHQRRGQEAHADQGQLLDVGQASAGAAEGAGEAAGGRGGGARETQGVRGARLQVRRQLCSDQHAAEDEEADGEERGQAGRGGGGAGRAQRGRGPAAEAARGWRAGRAGGAAAGRRVRLPWQHGAALPGRGVHGGRHVAHRAGRRERQRQDDTSEADAGRVGADHREDRAQPWRARRPGEPAPRRPARSDHDAVAVHDAEVSGGRILQSGDGHPQPPVAVRLRCGSAKHDCRRPQRRPALARGHGGGELRAAAHSGHGRAHQQPGPRVHRGAGRVSQGLRGRCRAREPRPVLRLAGCERDLGRRGGRGQARRVL
mmetsp:Transcript_23195/g.66901  ORF Transcript_23195/g.66901 Transcript_23195/m.66901 type:complete len:338 (-) Transcript_23195:130-1143(-)